jgi:hypothetical protein
MAVGVHGRVGNKQNSQGRDLGDWFGAIKPADTKNDLIQIKLIFTTRLTSRSGNLLNPAFPLII